MQTMEVSSVATRMQKAELHAGGSLNFNWKSHFQMMMILNDFLWFELTILKKNFELATVKQHCGLIPE